MRPGGLRRDPRDRPVERRPRPDADRAQSKGQQLACERAYARSGIDPASVAYVECHATGTKLGDRVELETVGRVFGPGQPVGSVKSNVGHLLTAAGVAGLVKTLFALREGMIPATVGIGQSLAAEIAGQPRILTEPTPWPGAQRRAAVNAFGFGGVNAHLVVDAPGQPAPEAGTARRAASAALLTGLGAAIGDCPDLAAVARALAKGQPRLRPLPAGRHAGLPFDAPAGAYLDRVAIDALRLRVPPNDIDRMYPQQLLMLAVGDAALRDAGIEPGSRTAVIVAGAMDHAGHRLMARWEAAWRLEDNLDAAGFDLSAEERTQLAALVRDALHQPVDAVVMLSYVGSLLASRIAATWDLSGPAFMLTGDETGALRALDLGAKLLASDEADAVLVGAVDLAGAIENLMVRQAQGVDRAAPVGEGAVAVVLEPAAAVRERGGAAYAEWRGAGFGEQPAEAARQAHAATGIAAAEPGLVEAGDTLPAAAELAGQPALASAAAVFGHARMAAPLLAALHAALALNARQLPAWAGWREAAAAHSLDGRAGYVPTEPRPWLRPRHGCRIAAVLARDGDGSAARALLAEAPVGIAAKPADWTLPLLLPVAGDSREAILAVLTGYLNTLEAGAAAAALCREAALACRAEAPLALALVADEPAGLIEEARAALAQLPAATGDWQSPRGSRFCMQPLGRDGGVGLVYSPLSTAFTGLAAGVGPLLPGLVDALCANHRDAEADTRALYPRQLAPLAAEQRAAIEEALLADNQALIKAGVIASWQYTRLLTERIGLAPAARFGHSLGQASMLFAAGAWLPDDGWMQRLAALGDSLGRLSGELPAVRAAWNLAEASRWTGPTCWCWRQPSGCWRRRGANRALMSAWSIRRPRRPWSATAPPAAASWPRSAPRRCRRRTAWSCIARRPPASGRQSRPVSPRRWGRGPRGWNSPAACRRNGARRRWPSGWRPTWWRRSISRRWSSGCTAAACGCSSRSAPAPTAAAGSPARCRGGRMPPSRCAGATRTTRRCSASCWPSCWPSACRSTWPRRCGCRRRRRRSRRCPRTWCSAGSRWCRAWWRRCAGTGWTARWRGRGGCRCRRRRWRPQPCRPPLRRRPRSRPLCRR
ncbi:hypothetical protein H9L41_11840 [Chitinimonas koreensis]|nr:hypothetical protein H9L41_11840 [Chitinimonas koreensis]